MYLINLHRIDKDVRRCDRQYWYFTSENLEKLRNIMCRYRAFHPAKTNKQTAKFKKKTKQHLCLCSYVWQHLDTGYVQGMCDLLAPLLVILDDGQ